MQEMQKELKKIKDSLKEAQEAVADKTQEIIQSRNWLYKMRAAIEFLVDYDSKWGNQSRPLKTLSYEWRDAYFNQVAQKMRKFARTVTPIDKYLSYLVDADGKSTSVLFKHDKLLGKDMNKISSTTSRRFAPKRAANKRVNYEESPKFRPRFLTET